MKRKIVSAVLILTVAAFAAGCSSYYKVSDPGSEKVYYTKDLDRNKSGSIVFEDATTGNTVTLQASEVKKIKKQEFRDNTSPQ